MKDRIKSGIYGIFVLWGALWLAFLPILAAQYISAGLTKSISGGRRSEIETGVCFAVGLFFAIALLIFFYFKDGEKSRGRLLSFSDIAVRTAIPVAAHFGFTVLSKNLFPLSVIDSFAIQLLNSDYETWSGKFEIKSCILPALLCAVIYALAIAGGTLLGMRHHRKMAEKLKSEHAVFTKGV